MLRRLSHVILCAVFILTPCACAPKKLVRGQILDAETGHPVEGAVVAIRWLKDRSHNGSDVNETFDAAQEYSDRYGTFRIPQNPGNQYIMGVYKEGYVCWSSRDTFLPSSTNPSTPPPPVSDPAPIADGMVIQLKPFKPDYRHNEHAGFTMQVAGSVTDNPGGPFHQAIKSEFELWRNDLRKLFEEALSKPSAR